MSFNSIAESLQEFGIQITKTRVFEFKQIIANSYTAQYELLKENLLKGHLIQVDETQIKMKQGKKGYICVFSNMNIVFYIFRPDRKAGFLKSFLQGFNGVLVSDFYSGYDGIRCDQQKCIVHLLRDLNSDFYKNQLDEDLKIILKNFGNLLKKIVFTVDKYGLRKRNLNKHKKDVQHFYNHTFNKKKFSSSIALKYKKRFLKYENKLWTFLSYDNVPWHNNNAEYAIKSFAKHREKENRIFTETSANTYTVLVSLEQSCKYQGIRFMDYLMGKEKI